MIHQIRAQAETILLVISLYNPNNIWLTKVRLNNLLHSSKRRPVDCTRDLQRQETVQVRSLAATRWPFGVQRGGRLRKALARQEQNDQEGDRTELRKRERGTTSVESRIQYSMHRRAVCVVAAGIALKQERKIIAEEEANPGTFVRDVSATGDAKTSPDEIRDGEATVLVVSLNTLELTRIGE
ncbi:hypothetical protein X777_15310 [Ooceraea biroi]|uniref:Uncharacterized protein n=1 Tax=Ooceraea biroi TaxID=2015173 RepID=A0A026WVK9_OOCBI|nr:hypothetical protein X777_15310 [Ooceraea biroi]